MSRIFISYRRDDADAEAGRIAERLIDHFGDAAVFHDRLSIQDGVRWKDRIDEGLLRCEVMLVVIGRQWEFVALADGTRRLHVSDDVVAYEVASALERKIRVVPLLVGRTNLPAAADLPPALRPLLEWQARTLHADAFAPLVESLIDGIEGRGARRRKGWVWASGAVAVAAVVTLGLLHFLPPRAPPVSITPVAQVDTIGDLHLRMQLAPDQAENKNSDGLHFVMTQKQPPGDLTMLLNPVSPPDARPVEYVLRGISLPLPRDAYEADIVPNPLSSYKAAPTRATVCLARSDDKPQQGPLRAIVECPPNDRCSAAADNPGPFVICGSLAAPRKTSEARRGWSWLSVARAQPAIAPSEPLPREDIWIIPSLETLHRRHASGEGAAFTEIALASPPLTGPVFDGANKVSVQITANDRLAWIYGLPPDASAVPFDASKGIDLKFGLENLGFSGAKRGHETIGLRLRFLAGAKVVHETSAVIDYIALRPQSTPVLIEPALGLRWTASYFPGSKEDRWQVFLVGSKTVEGLEGAKRKFDALNLKARIDDADSPLVAVIRPPLDKPVWGLNVGLLLPSGQIRFTFDDATAAALCGRLRYLARQSQGGVRADTYRRTVDGKETTQWCRYEAQRPA